MTYFMKAMIDNLKQKYENNKSTLLFCLIITFIIGMITHAYMYFSDSFSHDSLSELGGVTNWKIQLGRFLIPAYRICTRGTLTLPWLIGIYSLLWISLAVFLTVKLFNIKSKVFMALTSGIFTTNISVIATTATYIHDLDIDMFALLMSVLAVFAWCRYKKGYILSALCIFITLGLYQCYVSVTATLLIMFYILNLLKQEKFQTVFLNGLKFVAILLLTGTAYFITFKAVLYFGGIQEVSSYNTLDNMFSINLIEIIKNIAKTYIYTIIYLIFPLKWSTNILVISATLLSIIIAGCIILFRMFREKNVIENILTFILIALLPVAMNISRILSGMSHDLMHFAIWLVYFFALLVVYNIGAYEQTDKKVTGFIKKIAKPVCVSFLTVILLCNVVVANKAYLKKDLEQEATLAYFTRVVDQMDSMEGYDRKTTPVVFIGIPECFQDTMTGFEKAYSVTGSDGDYVLGAAKPNYYKSYFEYKLHYRIIVDEAETLQENDVFNDMPVFPKEGSMKLVDGKLIIKLG